MAVVPKVVALDFDGVLHSYVSGYTGSRPTDPPSPGAVEFVEDLVRRGFICVVVSSRAATTSGADGIRAYLAEHGFPWMLVTSQKLPAHAYLDDRAVAFQPHRGIGFPEAMRQITDLAHRAPSAPSPAGTTRGGE